MSAYLKTLTALSKPVLMRLPPELAHDLAIMSLKYMPLPEPEKDDPRLQTTVFETIFSNPIGLAAGFDKDGEIVNAARKLGFGFTEIGSVTPLPQLGNPKPRLWRVPELESIVNRMGMNSAGHLDVLHNLYSSHQMDSIPIGVSLGFNSDSDDIVQDFVRGYNLFTFEADYIVLNVSCPNVYLRVNNDHCLQRVLETLPLGPPVLIKISPSIDMRGLDRIVDLAKEFEVDGMIVSNTHHIEGATGSWSGRELFQRSTKMLAETYIRAEGKFPIIGVGGVMSADDAWTKLEAGASLVQVLTGFVYHGLDFANEIKAGLVERLIRERKALCSVIGSRAKELRYDAGYLKGTP